ncbi:Casein kinase I isoform delta-like [Trichinella zimbabwensis]|uniref:Casein kinase I isoform delta-like n=1 Tax=Trichinella zimbabwensis TaxID=268475 RepID=A0A0V1I247_9BILA|nr:Casein kinase I isoform delta-like [Trichinella zimbabwensis]
MSNSGNKALEKRFTLCRVIKKGKYGVVYIGMDNITKKVVVIKTEKRTAKPSLLCFEKKVHKYLSGSSFVPTIEYFGKDNCNTYLSMELLGPNMEDFFQENNRNLPIRDVCEYAIEIIKAIQFLHEKDFLHRDLKPENILLRRSDFSTHEVALTDFGSAIRYRMNSHFSHIAYRENLPVIGTPRYISIAAHLGIQQSPRDDLQSIGYILIYFAKGKLPWQDVEGVEQNLKIAEMKIKIKPEHLCQGLPSAFVNYMKYCNSLIFASQPDYSYLWQLFQSSAKQNAVMNYTEAESKVREATSDERWGPTGSMMADIARYTNAYDQFNEVMSMLWRRLFQESRKNWVRPYKCLILLEYLIKHGSEKVINDARERMFELRILESYQYNDDPTCDHGQKVRSRVKAIIELLQDDDRLYEERKAARHSKTQYIGISSSEYSQGGFHNYRRRRDSSEDRVVQSNACRRVENRHATYLHTVVHVDPLEDDDRRNQHYAFPSDGSNSVGQTLDNGLLHASRSVFDTGGGEFSSKRANMPAASAAAAAAVRLPSPPGSQAQTVGSDRSSDLLADVFTKPSSTIGVDNSWPASDDPFAAPQSSAGGNLNCAEDEFNSFTSYNDTGLSPQEFAFPQLSSQPLDMFASTLSRSNVPVDILDWNNSGNLPTTTTTGAVDQPASNLICLTPSLIAPVQQNSDNNATTNKSEIKLPDTWSDIGKIGLNLDSLSLSDRKDKPNRVTMNEMQNQKKQAAFDSQSSNSTSTVTGGSGELLVPTFIGGTLQPNLASTTTMSSTDNSNHNNNNNNNNANQGDAFDLFF